eukprot:SAG31_NODE_858_length_11437_cov_38.887049_4_plen_64_part_00
MATSLVVEGSTLAQVAADAGQAVYVVTIKPMLMFVYLNMNQPLAENEAKRLALLAHALSSAWA